MSRYLNDLSVYHISYIWLEWFIICRQSTERQSPRIFNGHKNYPEKFADFSKIYYHTNTNVKCR